MSTRRDRYRLNLKAGMILAITGLAASLALYILWGYQEKRVLGSAMKYVKTFREAATKEKDPNLAAKDYDLALRHLSQYLAIRSDDPEGLEIEAELMKGGKDFLGAASVYEHLIRINTSGERAQKARRSLAEIYIQYSDEIQLDPIARLMPEKTAERLRYHAAELCLDQMLNDEDPKTRVDDAEAYRLRGRAREGMIPSGKRLKVKKDDQGNPVLDAAKHPVMQEVEFLQEAIDDFKEALKRDPRDRIAAMHLAVLYHTRAKKPDEAKQVIRGLLEADPKSFVVRRDGYNFFKSIGDNQAASEELKKAYLLDPENLSVILTACKDALQSGTGTQEARHWIELVPARSRDEPEVYQWLGFIEIAEKNIAKALETWRKGLEKSGGSNPELNWRLAYTLLELNRDAEAGKLIKQLRRLVGNEEPSLRFLEAIQDAHAGRARAIERLEWVRDHVGPEMQGMVRLALGGCQEKHGDRDEAETTYQVGVQLDPRSVPLRLALARLRLATQPEDVEKDVLQGLQVIPDDPSLLMLLLQARLQTQLVRPAERRNWTDFDAAFENVKRIAPNNPALALMNAERLRLTSGIDRAVDFLKEAVERVPESPELAVGLAEGLLKQGKADQALKVLEQASTAGAAGDRGPLRVDRARILTALGRGREARDILLHDVNKLTQTDRADVWRVFVLLCKAQGDPNTNRAAFEAWTRLLPDDPQPKLELLEMEFETNNEASIRMRLDSLRPREDQDDLIWRLAQARERLWKRSLPNTPPKAQRALLEEANTLVESVLRDTKFDPTALVFKGLILELENDLGRAVDFYNRAWIRGNPAALTPLVKLLVRLQRWDDLTKLRQSDTSNQVDQIEAITCLSLDHKDEALKIVEQSMRERPATQGWQLGMLNLLGQGNKVEALLRKKAEQQPDQFEAWLTLLRYQASHGKPQAAAETIALVKQHVKSGRPELLEVQCRSAIADWPAADKAIEEALKRYPRDVEVQMTAARYFQGTGHSERSEVCLKQILELTPNDRSAARQLAIILSSRPATWQQALTLLGPEENMNSPEERLARAVVLARGEDPVQRQRAIDMLTELMNDLQAENSVAIAARDVLARLLFAAGQPAAASKIVAVAAQTEPSPSNVALYAETLILSEQFDAAQTQLDRLARISPGNPVEANLRARLVGYRDRKQPDKAAAALEKDYLAREKSPGAEMFGREAFRILSSFGGADSGKVAERMGQHLAKDNPRLSWMPAMILAGQGHREDALALCRTSIQVGASPEDLHEAGRVALSVALAAPNEAAILRQSDEILDESLRLAPEDDSLLVIKAMLSHLQSRFADEIRLYRAVLKRQPQNPVVLNNIAWALSEGINQPSEAMEKIDELVRIVGRGAETLDTRGVILTRMSRFDEAIKDLEEAVKATPSGTHLFHLAQAYKKAGRDAEFRKTREQARATGLSASLLDTAERRGFEEIMGN